MRKESTRLNDLRSWVSVCFAALSDYSLSDIAKLTGLSISTINRLWKSQYTLRVQFGTIQALAEAAGLRLIVGETFIRAEIINKSNQVKTLANPR